MNKWKIAFLISSTVITVFIICGTYMLMYSQLESDYCEMSRQELQTDYNYLIQIINETDLSRAQIKKTFEIVEDTNFWRIETDTLNFHNIKLVFDTEDKLSKIIKQ